LIRIPPARSPRLAIFFRPLQTRRRKPPGDERRVGGRPAWTHRPRLFSLKLGLALRRKRRVPQPPGRQASESSRMQGFFCRRRKESTLPQHPGPGGGRRKLAAKRPCLRAGGVVPEGTGSSVERPGDSRREPVRPENCFSGFSPVPPSCPCAQTTVRAGGAGACGSRDKRRRRAGAAQGVARPAIGLVFQERLAVRSTTSRAAGPAMARPAPKGASAERGCERNGRDR